MEYEPSELGGVYTLTNATCSLLSSPIVITYLPEASAIFCEMVITPLLLVL